MQSRSFSIIIVFVVLSLAGCALVPFLPVKLAPSETLPSMTVRFTMRGASARTVEGEVTSKVESALSRIAGVRSVSSRSYGGGGRVSVNFDRHADMETARFEVSAVVRQIWSRMPEGAGYPVISAQQVDDDNSGPFIVYRLNAPASPADIQAYGEENLKPLLAGIPGVAAVSFSGATPLEWRLSYDDARLESLGLTSDDLRRAVAEHLSGEFLGIAPQGKTGGMPEEYIRVRLRSGGNDGDFDPAHISVPFGEGKSVTLDKLVDAVLMESDPDRYFRINGLNSVYVSVSAADDANQISLAEKIYAAAAAFERDMPEGYMLDMSYDATDTIRDELDKIYFRSGLTVLILLLFVALVSLNLRYVALMTVCLAVTLAVAAVFYYFCGVEIQLYSLAGITISLNLIIDNLIVMTDHYMRRRDRKAFTAILAATATTAGALSVVYFMDERTRLSLQDFVTVVIINLAVSLAVSLFLVPALADSLRVRRGRTRGSGRRGLRRRLSRCLSRCYGAVVGFCVRFRIPVVAVFLFAIGYMVFTLPEEMNGYYRDREKGEPVLYVYASLPNGATLRQMDALVRKMERYLAGIPEIRQFQTSVMSPRRASITVLFDKEHQNNGFPYRFKSDVVSKALTLGGGSWSVFGLEDTPFSNDVKETAGSYGVTLTGYNYDELNGWAMRMRDSLLTHRRIKEVTVSSEFSYWKDDNTEFYFEADRDLLAARGLTMREVAAAVRRALERESFCGTVFAGGEALRVSLRSVEADALDVFALMRRPLSAGGKSFRLADIGTLEKRGVPDDVVKKDQEYVMCLQYEYIGSAMSGKDLLEKKIKKFNEMMPAGYKAVDRNYYGTRGDKENHYWLLLIVVAVVFFISSILFNSLRQPLAIVFIIPVSFIGVFLTLDIFDMRFNQGGFASLILLAGITVNAAIYLLNEYNSLRSRFPAMRPRGAFLRAFRVKIVPILLTVLSTVLGFIPFVVGETRNSFWFTLAAGTMGGLVVSLPALLLLLPALALPKNTIFAEALR